MSLSAQGASARLSSSTCTWGGASPRPGPRCRDRYWAPYGRGGGSFPHQVASRSGSVAKIENPIWRRRRGERHAQTRRLIVGRELGIELKPCQRILERLALWISTMRFVSGKVGGVLAAAQTMGASLRNTLDRHRRTRRAERRRFPIRWLTFKRRLHDDVEAAFNGPGGAAFFNEKYLGFLSSAVRQIESWQIRVITLQFAIIFFLLLGVVSSENSISLFGVSVKNATGVKEILIIVSATLTLVSVALVYAKEMRLQIIETVTRLTVAPPLVDLALVGEPSSFHSRFYAPKQYNRWIFPTLLSKLIRITFGSLAALMLMALLAMGVGIQFYVLAQIYTHPTLPAHWSLVAIVYSVCGYLLGLLGLIVQNVPLGHVDNEVLLELRALEASDPEAHRRRLLEVFGDE